MTRTTDPDAEPDAEAPTDARTDGGTDPERDVRGSRLAGRSVAGAAAVDADVPPDAPVFECAHCGRPFATEAYLALHRGLAHTDAIPDAEWAAYEAAVEAEEAALRRFRIVALGLLVLVYFGLLFAYAAFA